MKTLLRNTFILNLLIVLTLTGAGFFSYKTFDAYHMQQKSYSHLKVSTYLQDLSSLQERIDNEMLESASYLIQRSKASMDMMLQAREQTDKELFALHTMISSNPHYRTQVVSLDNIRHALHQARKEVDALPFNITQTLFKHYYLTLSVSISHMLEDLSLEPAFKKVSSLLRLYERLMALQSHTDMENTIVYATLVKASPLLPEEIEILQQLQAKDIPPQFKLYIDETNAIIFSSIFDDAHYTTMLENAFRDLMHGTSTGKYTLNIVSWLELIKKKKELISNIEERLQTIIKTQEEEHSLAVFIPLVSFALLSLLLLYATFKLITVRTKRIKNQKLYDDTLKDIELVFTTEEQKRLKRLIENGNLDHIYKFLIQAIKDANHTKDLFLANMSHEIRTPLNGIVGFTQLLKETETNEEQEEFISVIEKSSEHLLKIVNDILDLAKIKAQKIEVESIPFDPLEKFETAVETYAGKALKENIDLNVFIDPHLPTPILGDPTKISQVLVNLLSNAIKFTPKNGEVNVRVERRTESDESVEIYFAVSDTGIGITKEQRKKIFQAFSQADVSTSRKYGGTGLGLSISGKLVELMGGKLGIRSIPHEGSTFHFTLTLAKNEESKPREVERHEGMRVGILDPHLETEYFPNLNLAAYISYTGASVMHYTDASLMQEKERGMLPDVLFIDHKFRQRGGELERLLQLNTKIVLLTTGDQKRNLKRYKDKIAKILYKPVTFNKTVKVLSNKVESQTHTSHANFHGLNILVAEDNSINQQLITRVLNNLGIDVTIAHNGEEALELRKTGNFDMIFMDIEMPVMGGMEATAKILAYERETRQKHIPIIALTANALSGDRAKYLGAGMDGYLAKPIDLNALNELFLSYFPDKEEVAY